MAVTPSLAGQEKLEPLASRFVTVASLPWKATKIDGVEMKVLLEEPETGLMTALVRFAPGAELPPPPDANDEPDSFVEDVADTRAEPDLSLFSAASLRAGETAPAERREPTIVPGAAMKPSAQSGKAAEDTLRLVLDELVACRRLIDAALAGDNAAGQNGRSAEI